MNLPEFLAKWKHSTLSERSAAQSWFNDLCRVLGVETPTDADPEGTFYTFERGASKATGGDGWADVWKRGHFAWEFKGKHANLEKAYGQLSRYVAALENPPLLVVSDFERIVVYPNFTNLPSKPTTMPLGDLNDEKTFQQVKALWTDPERWKPQVDAPWVTNKAATELGKLALSLRDRGVEPHRAAHFTVELLFCFFAEDIGLLPKGLFTQLLDFGSKGEVPFNQALEELLMKMRDGGYYHFHAIPRFNGGLFDEIVVEPLTVEEIRGLREIARLDWGMVEPAIFGTLFERSLDPARRSQLGAHYTGVHDIERVVEPVVMTPLRRRWEEVRGEAEPIVAEWREARQRNQSGQVAKQREAFRKLIDGFLAELRAVTILDPACGSGNFLYVALRKLMDLEKEVIFFAAEAGLPQMFAEVSPRQVLGLEINEYAVEITRTVVWIGYLQWRLSNGFGAGDPVLEPLDTIRLQDALLDLSDPEHPKEAQWPAADYIIGNPPFLGSKLLRTELGDEYVNELFREFNGRVARESDLCCYFFEKARAQIEDSKADRAGLLATNSIRGGANRRVLQRIKQTGEIFYAWSDEPWILDGAAVRISIVAFDDGSESNRVLNGSNVGQINADLTHRIDASDALTLVENLGLAFMGDTKGGPFDISGELASGWLRLPVNPNGRSNEDVLRPWANGLDLTRRRRSMWIIDFGVDMPLAQAVLYEEPFNYVEHHVKPERLKNKRESYRERWWIHAEPRRGMRAAVNALPRFIVTPTLAKFRSYAWLEGMVLPDHQLIVVARDDDYFFGVLHSRAHEAWSLRMGTSLEDRPRYTPTTCFETFPFPWPPGKEQVDDPRVQAIAAAAKELDEKRRAWLDPPGATGDELKKRTLTNLYNQRPTWLQHLHSALDRAVWDAYGWPKEEAPGEVAEEVILERLLELNHMRASSAT